MPTVALEIWMPPIGFTVTWTLADVMPVALAVILAVCCVLTGPPVTGTDMLVWPDVNVTVPGTVAALVLSEIRVTTNPLAGLCPPVSVSARFPEASALMVIGPVKLMVGAVTVTTALLVV